MKEENFLDTTTEDWRAEIEKLTAQKIKNDSGKTTLELAKEWKTARRSAEHWIRDAAEIGLCKEGKRTITRAHGRSLDVPVYDFKSLTFEEIKERVSSYFRPSDPGLTIAELAEQLNLSCYLTRQKVKELEKAGRCKCGRGARLKKDGKFHPQTVYQLVPKKENTK
jgi:predicted transcriptional regulator